MHPFYTIMHPFTETNYDKYERAKIVSEWKDKRRVSDMENQIQHFKTKAYYKASNDQHSINSRQEKVDILEELTEAEREYGMQKIHCLEKELVETREK